MSEINSAVGCDSVEVMMKKGEIYEGIVTRMSFPNKGYVPVGEHLVMVKNALPGQKVQFRVQKLRKGQAQGQLLAVLENAPIQVEAQCPHFGKCGGCLYQGFPYAAQVEMKQSQVKELLDEVIKTPYVFEPALGSPCAEAYRNKMEFSFGDEYKDGPLALGMHKRNSFYDVVDVAECKIVDEDYRAIRSAVQAYFAKSGDVFYHKMTHVGYLRHLLVRKAAKTGEIMVALVTSTQGNLDEEIFVETLLGLQLDGEITGILHILNDRGADVVQSDETRILYGKEDIYEELLGLRFRITPFSFFQTNSAGAEVLYDTVRSYIGETKDKVVFDLYSGTGTIAQILAPVATKVVGVEIVEEAVEAARENARLNQLDNCEFWAGDVLKVIDELEDKPDLIVLDPPRDGIHPKALQKIIDFGVEQMVYVSCKPTSLARDLVMLQEQGYQVEKCRCVDMFPWTGNMETVCKLMKQ